MRRLLGFLSTSSRASLSKGSGALIVFHFRLAFTCMPCVQMWMFFQRRPIATANMEWLTKLTKKEGKGTSIEAFHSVIHESVWIHI